MGSISNPQPHQPTSRSDKAALLRDLVVEQVLASSADGILFSGGLDTSILATVAAAHGRRLQAVMVSVHEGIGLDEPFALLMANRLGMQLEILRPTLSQLLDRMPELIRTLHTFDPMELRNSVVTYVALETVARHRLTKVLTGDAADELFAGYNFMVTKSPEELQSYIRHLNEVMHFTSPVIGKSLGVAVDIPYLGPAIRQFALSLAYKDLVNDHEGQRFGKQILRWAFSDLLPAEIAWRVKTPIEYGSGSTALQNRAEQSLSEAEFERERERILKQDSVRLRDREQLFYYRIYRSSFSAPGEYSGAEKRCRECLGPLPRPDSSYCRVCGAYPAQ
jgi:asparagine synthase (glutamine-hydrolysing)